MNTKPPTKKMTEVLRLLADGGTIEEVATFDGGYHIRHGDKFDRISRSTFTGLRSRGMIREVGRKWPTAYYDISRAGREYLAGVNDA